MRETQFQAEIRASLLYWNPQGMYIKIPDAMRGGNSRFIPKKPFDIIFLTGFSTLCLEAKLIKRYMGRRKKKSVIKGSATLKVSQEDKVRFTEQANNLIHAKNLGNQAYFIIGARGLLLGEKHHMSAYLMIPEQMLILLESIRPGVASISLATIQENSIRIPAQSIEGRGRLLIFQNILRLQWINWIRLSPILNLFSGMVQRAAQ